ncbi:MAG: S9 family peptidase [Phycisphaerales bacterium]|nr:S9 family peptidase [Phycisphaerales bacterium]
MKTRRSVLGLILVLPVATALAGPPETPRQPVTDTYHGVKVVDDYRWLEDWSDPKVQAWSEAQNRYARSVLDALPSVEAIRERVTEVLSAPVVRYGSLHEAGGSLFAMKTEPPKQQPFIVVMPSAHHPGDERVVLDPNTLDPTGGTSMDWFVPSHDGSMIAVSLSHGGSEAGDVHTFDVATGAEVHEVVPRANGGTAGGSLAWAPDDSGFYYTRYPREGERPADDMAFYTQVYYHTLGTPTDKDRYEAGKDWPRIAEIQLEVNPADGKVLATVQKGDGGEFAVHVRGSDGSWKQISDFTDPIVQATFGPHDSLLAISRGDTPRGKIQRIDLADPSLSRAVTIIPQGDDTIVSDFWDSSVLATTDSLIYLTYQLGGPSVVRAFGYDGAPAKSPRALPVSTASGITPTGGDSVLFQMASYVDAPAWYECNGRTGAMTKTALATHYPVDFSDCEVVREFATSKDGTKVPVNIVRKKGLSLDGSHPCLVTGYGGYGVNITPGFSAADRVLIEQGFVLAEANIRGGGEYGEEWHTQGNLTNKQNVFDDFAAACRYMIDSGYTTTTKLAILGGSNGGLLMGATLTQHPDLMSAVVSYVGIYDMLRVELSSNGSFNIPEFGTVKNPEQFKALYAYSPYHHVKDGVHYPPVLFLTGANDPRVDPLQSRKMTARLQAAEPEGLTLLRTSSSSGHGIGTALSERIEQTVDVDAFLFAKLGVDYRPVGPQAGPQTRPKAR